MTEIIVEVNSNATLLGIAKNNLKGYKGLEIAYPNDDGMINLKGYLLQQTIELALKHRLETNGIDYPKTHDIERLLDLQPEEDAFSELRPWAGTITNLESKTRYLKNYNASVKTVNSVKKLAVNLIDVIEQEEQMCKIQNKEFKSAYLMCDNHNPLNFMKKVVKEHGTNGEILKKAVEAVTDCRGEMLDFTAKLLQDTLKTDEYKKAFEVEQGKTKEQENTK